MVLAVFFAILTFFGWAIGDIFGVLSSRKIGAFGNVLWVNILTLPYLALMAPFFLADLTRITLPIALVNALLGLVVTAAYLAFSHGVKIGKPSIVGAISGSFPAIVVVLSILFFQESLSGLQLAAISVIIIGIVLASLDLRELRAGTAKLERSAIFALIAMVLWGIFFTFIRIPIESYGWFWSNVISDAAGTLALLIYGWRQRELIPTRLRAALPFVIGVVLIGGSGMLTYNLGLEFGKSSVVAPIAGAYPALFVTLSAIIFKDKLTRVQTGGMVLSVLGIIALSLASV